MSMTLSTLEKGKFMARPQPNPQVYQQQQQQLQNVSRDSIEIAKAVITLRSGKEVSRLEISSDRQTAVPTPKVTTKTYETKEKSNEASLELKKSVNMEAEMSKEYRPVVPYPQRLTAGQKNKYHTKIQEIFNQVKINILLLDAIQQVPSYAKFLKDLCTVKRKLNVKNKTFLTKQVNALILRETHQKFRDLGSPTISIMIGECGIGRALLDLGSSVNLLPFSVYGQLRLVDFVVWDMQQPVSTIYQTLVILGRPFLATSNALINCQSGVLKLTFRIMTLEMNMFNACNMPSGCDDSKVHTIDLTDDFDILELLSILDSDSTFENESSEQRNIFYKTVRLSRELTESKG
ncbi:uncharacterized protein LOC131158518 [Malania oleifera]|uniref:uncharacterized protein LOC131158518 n=1 Tax=Malania oleifera TaxID=397392 RepID=UPI0025AE0B3C|nr:uncharacterized protein LOC131158518 [Malania oleifera]